MFKPKYSWEFQALYIQNSFLVIVFSYEKSFQPGKCIGHFQCSIEILHQNFAISKYRTYFVSCVSIHSTCNNLWFCASSDTANALSRKIDSKLLLSLFIWLEIYGILNIWFEVMCGPLRAKLWPAAVPQHPGWSWHANESFSLVYRIWSIYSVSKKGIFVYFSKCDMKTQTTNQFNKQNSYADTQWRKFRLVFTRRRWTSPVKWEVE